VRRNVDRGVFYTPKTKRSRRAVDLSDQLLDVLRGLRARQAETGVAEPETLIFGDEAGRPRNPDQLRKRVWYPALAAAGLRHVTPHSLRHFFASMLIAQGENLKYVSSQLRHASIQITVDRYGHLLPEERTSARRLEARLWAAGTGLLGSASQHRSAEPAGLTELSRNPVEDAGRLSGENHD
jgi:integrase